MMDGLQRLQHLMDTSFQGMGITTLAEHFLMPSQNYQKSRITKKILDPKENQEY
jgi:hypothetical protein